jgi:hypothetical protein
MQEQTECKDKKEKKRKLFETQQSTEVSQKEDEVQIGCRLKKDALNKKIFRGMRSYLMKLFDKSDLSRGKHHWNEQRWVA